MHIVQVNYVYDPLVSDPDELLDRYRVLTSWAENMLAAGATRSSVVQRFRCDGERVRNGVSYCFRADGAGADPAVWNPTRRVNRAAAVLRPTVVHVNGLAFAVQTIHLRRLVPDSALVLQDHANGIARHPLRRTMARRALAAADAVFFSTRAQAVPWTERGLVTDWPPVYEVMGGATALGPLDRDAARQATGVAGAPAALWVGRLNANKDPLTVLSGVEAAADRLPGLTLTMIFESGELRQAVERRVGGSCALSSRVRLIGQIPHEGLAAYYSAADLFVLGSHHEGSGYALIEALGCGAIPVVTDIPTFRAITANGRLGRLWPPGDAQALAAAIEELGGVDRARTRAAAIAHADRHLTWSAVARVALEAYSDILQRGGREERRSAPVTCGRAGESDRVASWRAAS